MNKVMLIIGVIGAIWVATLVVDAITTGAYHLKRVLKLSEPTKIEFRHEPTTQNSCSGGKCY